LFRRVREDPLRGRALTGIGFPNPNQQGVIEVNSRKRFALTLTAGLLTFGVAACGGDDGNGDGSSSDLSGSVVIDGSSTVAPLSEPAGELFNRENPDVRVTVGTSGTGGGFEKFCAGDTDISDASRAISEEEIELCDEGGIDYEEVVVANDALTVVVNPENPIDCLTVDQVSQIYSPDSRISNWNEIEGLDTEYDESLEIFSPGSDSGTFDYFTEAINGEEGAQRTQAVNIVGEDDNATVTGVSGSRGGVGYFGYSFAEENADTLKALQIDDGNGCVEPSPETTQAGDYTPLGRQLFIYPAAQSLQRPEVLSFVEFYLDNVNDIAPQAGFIGLTEEQLAESQDKVASLADTGGGGGGG
jgi:phosphate transport system substrate-binding protein